jgi:phosphohistidine phosphatase
MNLYIMRHAQAEVAAESASDEGRRLTPSGRERTRDAAAGLRAVKLRFDAILTSPLTRAAETAELVAAAYANNPPPQVLPALSPGISPREALAAIAPFARHDELLLVGHEPQLGGLLSLLLSGSDAIRIKLKKGACVALDLPKRFEPGVAELRWMLTQRYLRKLRK